MQQFMQTISRLHRENYHRHIEEIIQQKQATGLAYAWDDIESCRHMKKRLESFGFHLQAIFVPGLTEWPAEMDGIPIVPFAEIQSRRIELDVVLLVDHMLVWMIHEVLQKLGYRTLHLRSTDYEQQAYEIMMKHLPEMGEAYSLLADEESRAVFCAYLLGSYSWSMEDYRFAPEAQYMLAGFLPQKGDIAIDGGCYDGQTARQFVLCGAKVFSFELDSENYKNCRQLAKTYGFSVENAGLGRARETMAYTPAGTGSSLQRNGDEMATVIDIDTYLLEHRLPRLDYLKLDVEGAELDTLQGAVIAISRDKPKMAISAYHKKEDLWQLIQYLHSLRPDYEFSLRHYKIDTRNYLVDMECERMRQELGLSPWVSTDWELVLYCR